MKYSCNQLPNDIDRFITVLRVDRLARRGNEYDTTPPPFGPGFPGVA